MKSSYAIYELPCGHSQEIRKQHYKAGRYRCKTCQNIKHSEEAKAIGLTLIEDLGSYKKYQLPCSHYKNILPEQVRTGIYACDDCKDSQRKTATSKLNIEILSTLPNKLHIKFLSCGHTQIVKSAILHKDNSPICKECIHMEHLHHAEREGLLIVNQTNLTTTREFTYLLPCGCLKKLKAGNVKRGIWACDTHSNWWNKSSGIYVLKLTLGTSEIVKIGVTCNVKSRIASFGLADSVKFELIEYYTFENFKHATDVEKTLHKDFSHLKLPCLIAKTYLQSGYTECYPIEHLGYLIQQLEYSIGKNK